MKILVLNGPNLGRLDLRDSKIYGEMTFPQLSSYIADCATELGFQAEVRQSDSEVQLISWLHEAADGKIPLPICWNSDRFHSALFLGTFVVNLSA